MIKNIKHIKCILANTGRNTPIVVWDYGHTGVEVSTCIKGITLKLGGKTFWSSPKESHQNNDENESKHDNIKWDRGVLCFQFFEAFMEFWNLLFWVYIMFLTKNSFK